jgi:hypothetical protein
MFKRMSLDGWANTAGVAGLLLAGYTFTTDRLAGRRAELEMRFEEIHYPMPASRIGGGSQERFVIENNGRHAAQDVQLTVTDASGEHWQNAALETSRVARIYPGHSFHVRVSRAFGSSLGEASISWKDGRLRRQEMRIPLSVQHL